LPGIRVRIDSLPQRLLSPVQVGQGFFAVSGVLAQLPCQLFQLAQQLLALCRGQPVLCGDLFPQILDPAGLLLRRPGDRLPLGQHVAHRVRKRSQDDRRRDQGSSDGQRPSQPGQRERTPRLDALRDVERVLVLEQNQVGWKDTPIQSAHPSNLPIFQFPCRGQALLQPQLGIAAAGHPRRGPRPQQGHAGHRQRPESQRGQRPP
jgi:hypothetical protein